MQVFLDTPRLRLRRLTYEDQPALRPVLQDIAVMYAWEHAFSDQEVRGWISRSLARYEKDGFAHFAAERLEDGALVGMAGLVMEEFGQAVFPGVGWLLARRWWGRGYATEAAAACLNWLFANTGWERAGADIRPQNTASRRVAERLGMRITGEYIKRYQGKEMPHLIYEISRQEWQARL